MKNKGMVGIALNGLTLPHFCACPKPGPWFPTSYVVFFVFSEWRWEVNVCFLDIGWIVDHHCLYFLFITKEDQNLGDTLYLGNQNLYNINRFNFAICLDVLCHMLWCFLYSVRGECLLCWYWWNFWPSLFKASFHKMSKIVDTLQTRGSVGWACVTHLSFCFEET